MAPVPKRSKPSQEGRPQFSISSFLPMLPPPVPSTSALPKAKALDPVSKPKGNGKAKEVLVISDDDETEDTKVDLGPEALWIDRFAPASRDELGVHPKKAADVALWLSEAYDPKRAKYRRILVLSGPSGAAKTATLKVLCKEEAIDILEWRNASNHEFAAEGLGRESLVNQFSNFLARAGMAPALELGSALSSSSSSRPLPKPPFSNKKRLILLEDLPNTSHYPTKLALRSALQQYLASPRVTCPLVVIVTEALVRPGVGHEAEMTMGEGRGDSVDARSVCGVEVLYAPACREIQFNPIAVTIMKKALLKILDKAYPPGTAQQQRPSTATLELLVAHANGDIRSALMSLQFLASDPKAKGVTNFGGGALGAGGSKKRKPDGRAAAGPSGDEVKKLLQFVTARESSLFIFHALGKVLFSKRWGISADDDKKDLGRPGVLQRKEVDKLPRHLRARWAREPSKVDPDTLFAEAPVDSDVFLSYIQHNYTQFTNTIDECLGIAEGISMADSMMRLEGDDWLRRAPLTSQYSFALAVRSTLISLPSPVPHRKQVLRKSAVWEKLKQAKANEERAHGLLAQARPGREVWSDWAPFLGRIGDAAGASHAASAFWKEMATFPPVSNMRAGLTGEALGEKEVEEEEEQEEEEDDAAMELEEPDRQKEEEVWWDETDDIMDD